MGLGSWTRTHQGVTAFAAGALLTLVAVAAVGYFILSDQRRSARVLAAALSQALAREVRIDRVTDVTTQRVVMRGVRLPREGGWPVDLAAETVEATGPLLAVARGDAAPLRLSVTRPAVDVPPGPVGAGAAWLDAVRQGVAGFLAGSTLLDVTLTGGVARRAGGTLEFDLILRKGRGEAKGELIVRAPGSAPLVLAADGRLDGETARLSVSGRGGLAPLSGWLPDLPPGVWDDRRLELALDVTLRSIEGLHARGRLTLGDGLATAGEATLRDDVLGVALPRAEVDLAFAAATAGLAWRPIGRAELTDVTATWQTLGGAPPSMRATVRVPALALPATGVGAEVAAEGLEGRFALEPAAAGFAIHGDARATGVSAAGFEADALLQRLAPGWFGPADRLRLAGLRVAVAGLDAASLQQGSATLELQRLHLARADGEFDAGRTTLRAALERDTIALALEAEGVVGAVPALRGEVPRLAASADLARLADGSVQPTRAAVAARDRQGRELLTAELRPTATPGRVALSARAPDLSRLDGLWPALERRVNGSASLDVEVSGSGFGAVDGRLVLNVPEAELLDGKVSVRDLAAKVPIRRGTDVAGEPPWGEAVIGELISYGVVARDVTSRARVWHDRLSLNDLTYALYSGDGKGWADLELEAAGPLVRGNLRGERVRMEEFVSAYGIRGGTMTGLLRYDVDFQYRAGRLGVNGKFEVPKGGTVNIELLNRLLVYATADPTGVLRAALRNLRAFEYKSAKADLRSSGDDIRVSLALKGREWFGIFPPKVREINIHNMPLGFLARQFPGS